MKKSARIVQAEIFEAPGVGPISWIERGIRRFVRLGSRPAAEEGAETEREGAAVRGAHRSAMDAGITGGLSLLGGPIDRGRR